MAQALAPKHVGFAIATLNTAAATRSGKPNSCPWQVKFFKNWQIVRSGKVFVQVPTTEDVQWMNAYAKACLVEYHQPERLDFVRQALVRHEHELVSRCFMMMLRNLVVSISIDRLGILGLEQSRAKDYTKWVHLNYIANPVSYTDLISKRECALAFSSIPQDMAEWLPKACDILTAVRFELID
jgi:hypothetical protein